MLLASLVLLPETLPAEESRSFGENVLVNTPGFWDSGVPEIALAPDGVIYVVWNTAHGDDSIYIAKSIDGGRSFCCQRRVNDDAVNATQSYPSVAVGPDGSVHVAWSDYRNDLDRRWTHDGGIDGINDDDIYYATSVDGGLTFLPNVKVNDDVGTRQSTHMHRFLAVDHDNKVHIAWGDLRSGKEEVYYANSTDGGLTFNPNVKVSDIDGNASNPSLAINSKGTVFVAWSGHLNESLGSRIFLSRSSDGGVSFDESRMVSAPPGYYHQTSPEIAVSGEFVGVVWVLEGVSEVTAFFAGSLDAGDSFSQSTRVADIDPDIPEWDPSVVVNATGYVAVSWKDRRTSEYDIYFSESHDFGQSFEPDVRVNDDGTMYYQFMPSVAVDHNGHIYIVWYDFRSGMDFEIYFAMSPSSLADLTVSSSDILFSDGDAIPYGTEMTVNATIWNAGNANASDVLVAFFDGRPDTGELLGTDTIPSIERYNGSGRAEVVWSAIEPQFHDICVLIDPDNDITESNETNNTACRAIEVIVPPIPAPPGNLTARLSGSGFSDVTLEWSLSPDDGGSVKVSRYDIFRSDSFDSTGAGYVLIGAVPNGTGEYVDAGAGEGDPNNHFYYVCAIGDMNISSCTQGQAGKFTRVLNPGPNLISLPLIQSNESIDAVLRTVSYDAAWYFDSVSEEWEWHMTSKEYRRGLWTVDHTIGLWVNATVECNLTVAGAVPAQTTIRLNEGWNLVSFPSFSSSYTINDLKTDTGAVRSEGYDSALPHHLRVLGGLEVLLAGEAYWVKVDANVDWIVEVS